MSSTSSSECVCGECSRYGNKLGNGYGGTYKRPQRTPFYPIMGQPLVYYAQVQQSVTDRQRSNENRQPNANCFVKAFRWYTKEHLPSQTSASTNTKGDIAGFAIWLDTKYNEYIQENQLNRGLYHHLKVKQTSTIEAERISNNVCEPCSTKKFTRMKRPWIKRRRRNSKEAGDVIEKSSFEYIMQPKDLTHRASECCHPCVSRISTDCCNHSSAISESNNMQDFKKTTEDKSLSLTKIRQDKDKDKSNDIVNVQEIKRRDPNEDKGKKEITSECNAKPIENAIALPMKQPKKKNIHEVSCQCFEETVAKTDAQTQCCCPETKTTESSTHKYNTDPVQMVEEPVTPIIATQTGDKKLSKSGFETNYVDGIVQINQQSNQCSKECTMKVDAQSQYNGGSKTTSNITQNNIRMAIKEAGQQSHIVPRSPAAVKEIDSFIVENLATLTKTTRSFTIFVNDAAQTSDHSISIDKVTTHEYPLFMKIICADKLNDKQ